MFAAFDKHLVSAPFINHGHAEALARQADAQLVVHGLTATAGVQPVHEIVVDQGGFVAAALNVDVAETKVASNMVRDSVGKQPPELKLSSTRVQPKSIDHK